MDDKYKWNKELAIKTFLDYGYTQEEAEFFVDSSRPYGTVGNAQKLTRDETIEYVNKNGL